ncbi:MAG: hypothetical protein ACRYGF_09130, partial [Janthinobacterium lividum]
MTHTLVFRSSLIVCGAVLCVAARAAAPADISGTWTTQTEVQGIAVNETCHVAQAADGKLSGTCETSGGVFKLTGTLNGTAVNFTHPAAYGGEDSTVSFFGKLDDEVSISGSLDLQPLNAGGSFAMKKQ